MVTKKFRMDLCKDLEALLQVLKKEKKVNFIMLVLMKISIISLYVQNYLKKLILRINQKLNLLKIDLVTTLDML